MWRFAVGFAIVFWLGACNQIVGIPDVIQGHRIGGRVHGLWDGTDGVRLRLQADGIDTMITATTNGGFRFENLLTPGTSYTVTVVTNPVQHTCVADSGGGMVADVDVTSTSVACTGPTVVVALSGQWGWMFDPTEEVQTFAGSIVVQDVALTVSGSSLNNASVDGITTKLGDQTLPIALPLGMRMVQVALTASGGLSKTYQLIFNRGTSVMNQIAYGKASNTGVKDLFGASVSLSGDTLAVSAPNESSAATGVNGNQTNDNAFHSGAVYVFVRDGTRWAQQAYLKASNTEVGDIFGYSVSLSGNTLAISSILESGAATGINGNQNDNSASAAGAVYVFLRNGVVWSQQAYIKASNTEANDQFGHSVSLSGDTLAVGAPGEDSAATGIDGNQSDNSADGSGAVYVFVRSGTTWAQQAYLKASNTGHVNDFGNSVSLSGDTLAVGAPGEASAATGVNGNQASTGAPFSGAAYVFVRGGTTWTQQAYLKASNTQGFDSFGWSVSLSGDTLAVSAIGEASAATGVNGDQTDNRAGGAGAVYIFIRSDTTWTQQAYVKASNTRMGDSFGGQFGSVSLFGDKLAVGAPNEDSATIGVNGDQANDIATDSGAVYVFVRSGTTWAQQAYVKASNTGGGDNFGYSVSLSGDTLAVGALNEDSAAIGINGNQTNDTAIDSGAVYVFR